LTLRTRLFGSGNPAVADSLHNPARLLRDAGKHEEAETMMIASCAMRSRQAQPMHMPFENWESLRQNRRANVRFLPQSSLV
jgi:hypothetical protein